ncbi:MAG TPA: sigma-70 family RNA polymerase sigma factor, partial [Anaerolineales bacterium]
MTSFEQPPAGQSGETDAGRGEADRIGRARQGDGAAWEALVRTHQEPVFRFAYLLLGSAAEAEDAAQETFIRAYRALDRFDPQRALRPWLLSIAANLAHNRRRSIGRYLAALQRLGRSEPHSPDSIEEKTSRRMEAQSLWKA